MELTISIVLYNSIDGLEACLDSIRADCVDGWAEVVAVDNASPDESVPLFRSRFPTATVVSAEHNLGFAAGTNLCWPLVRGRYWLLLNPDVIVPAGGLRRLVGWMDDHPRVGVSSPHLIGAGDGPGGTARRFPSISLALLELSRAHLLMSSERRGRTFLGAYCPGVRETDADWLPGTAMLLRRSAVEQVGLLSDRFFMYGEDVEYCWRMKQAGWHVRLPPDLAVLHRGGASADRSWGATEARRRNTEGWYRACSLTRGRRYARALLGIDWLALGIEAGLPWRSPVAREAAREGARSRFGLWWTL
jgi:GT2 family glycosyltransferase